MKMPWGQVGDILVAFDAKEHTPQHILFLLPPKTGIGLWFLESGKCLNIRTLKDLDANHQNGDLYFKYCPLDVALASLIR